MQAVWKRNRETVKRPLSTSSNCIKGNGGKTSMERGTKKRGTMFEATNQENAQGFARRKRQGRGGKNIKDRRKCKRRATNWGLKLKPKVP